MKRNDIKYNDQSMFRLRVVHFGTIGKDYGINLKELIDWPYDAFMIPEKMNTKEAFYVLSYLIQKIEQDLKLEECSHQAVTILNKILEDFYFRKVPECKEKIVDLYTITGDMRRFNKSEYNSKYFEWFTDEVDLEKVKGIYDKYGYTFKELIFS